MQHKTNYELLFQCYLTGQMTPGQMQEHMRQDEVFRSWVNRRMAERRRTA